MHDEFVAFLKAPGKETFLAVRALIAASEGFDPYSRELDQAIELLQAERYADCTEALRAGMPGLLLSPRAHLIFGMAAKVSGDQEQSEFEYYVASTCVEGILSTGNGSATSPYLVLRTSDEYDVLEYLEKEFSGQTLAEYEGKHYDIIKCTDGTEYCFDISEPYAKLQQRFGDSGLDELPN